MSDFRDHFSVDPCTTGSATLEVLRITDEPRTIMIFTPECEAVRIHYLDTDNYRGYVQCNEGPEGKCLLCAIRKKRETRIVVPVYDIQEKEVAALLVSDTRSPHSLGPQLRTVFDTGSLHERIIMISRRSSKYDVTTLPMPPDAETGETVIAAFLEHVKAGRLTLESAIPRLANVELAEYPEHSRVATVLGLDLDAYRSAQAEPAVQAHE